LENKIESNLSCRQLHLVHYNGKKFPCFTDAVSQDKGLTVVGIFLDIGDKPHPEFDKITRHMKDIQFKGESVVIRSPIDIYQFLPSGQFNL
jgi:carbonic anhydrase